MNKRFLGRQAILDANLKLYGYELMFCAGDENTFSGNAEEATNQVIDSCISMAACSSSKNLFISCTREVLLDMRVKLLPPRSVVLEILRNVEVDNELIKACKLLTGSGFRLALDTLCPDDSRTELIKLADYIKIDFLTTDANERKEIYEACRGTRAKFVAERVKTQEDLEAAKAEGCTFFQGYFHSAPEVISEAQIPARKLSYLQILALLAQEDVDQKRVGEILLTEPSLCYRLLRLANSALYGLRNPVNSIQSALLVVGDDAFKKMVVVALVGMLPGSMDSRDITQTLERAYFCESLAPILRENSDELYMLGMLSKMHVLLGVDMGKLVELLNPTPRISQALLGVDEELGNVLNMCQYFEQWTEGNVQQEENSEYQEMAPLYFEAILSAGKVMRELNAH